MIELRRVTVSYGERTVLRDVDLTVAEGELVLVAGRTGVGKSTLLGTFNGLVPAFTGGRLTGDVLVDGVSVVDRPPRERVDVVGYVGQDPSAGFVTDSVEEELAYGMEQLGLPAATMRRRVEESLDLLGIAALRRRNLRTLSGGEQQRVAIGAVLTMHPRLLVLDEPTSALDPTAAEDVLATLSRLVQDLGVSVVLAEHRLERVVPFADQMVLLTGDHGAVVSGDPALLLRHAPVAPPLVELGRAAGWEPLPLTVRDARRRARGLVLAPSARPAPSSGPATTDALVARRLSVAHGRHVALREVALSLPERSVTALMGRNGAGKSTLLWALQGSGRRDAGSVEVLGEDPATVPAARRRCLVGLVPQTPADLLYLETVAEECETADRQAASEPGATRALLDRLVPGVPEDAHPRDLSEGQRLALVLAIVLVSAPKVLLLDEPTRGLDYPGKDALGRILRDLTATGTTVLLATHDVEFVAAVAEQAVVLAEGEVVSAGPAATVLGETPAFAPQVQKVLGAGWLTVAQVVDALGARADTHADAAVRR